VIYVYVTTTGLALWLNHISAQNQLLLGLFTEGAMVKAVPLYAMEALGER
jgi:hypothetical protein